MDPKLLDSFGQFLQDLDLSDISVPEGEFLGSNFWMIRDGELSSKRLNTLREVIQIECPLLLGCKSDLFWKEVGEENTVIPQVLYQNKNKSSYSTSSVSDASLSICGSPLKLDVIADLSAINDSCIQPAEKYSSIECGLTVKTGRTVTSVFSTMLTSNEESPSSNGCQSPTLVLLTDGKHIQPISCMSVQALVDKQNNCIGVKNTKVISKQAAEQSIHRKNIQLNLGTSDVTCTIKYDLMIDMEAQSSLGVVFEWKRSDLGLLPFTDPPMESRATVNVQVAPGNCRSPAFSLFQETEILSSLIQGLATTEVDWIGTQERPLVDSVEDLVDQLKNGNNTVKYRFDETTSDEFMLEDIATLNERTSFDFTDHLWKVLQNCTSYSELVEAFTYIVSEMKSGELQPFLAGKNNTMIAMMVKDSFKGQLRIPNLIGLLPIEYLAEMGVLKLTRDYVYLLISKNLATLRNLEYFINENLDLKERLVRLQKLHNILEVVLLLKHNLNLPQASLADCTIRMLNHFEKKGMKDNSFSFNVPMNDVSHVVAKHQPIEWKAEGYKMVNNSRHEERTAYIFTSEKLFDWVECAYPINKNNSTFSEVDIPYFLTVVKESICIVN